MSKVERRVRSLVSDDSEMRDAVEVVLDNATDGEVQWVDVRDKITSGQWGRLIEKEVLVDGDTGFALADRDAIEAGLEEDDDDLTGGGDVDTPETTTWTVPSPSPSLLFTVNPSVSLPDPRFSLLLNATVGALGPPTSSVNPRKNAPAVPTSKTVIATRRTIPTTGETPRWRGLTTAPVASRAREDATLERPPCMTFPTDIVPGDVRTLPRQRLRSAIHPGVTTVYAIVWCRSHIVLMT